MSGPRSEGPQPGQSGITITGLGFPENDTHLETGAGERGRAF
jgi:hypothetical protein